MTNKFHLRGLAFLIGGLVLSGCGNKQILVPELEDARKAYAHASTDPVITSLAAAELSKAEKQLRIAETASAYFKPAATISHEATLAKLKILEAQQTARALAARENLRVAQLSPPATPLATGESPILAAAKTADSAPAALPATPLPVNAENTSATVTGHASGGHASASNVAQTELQQAAAPAQMSQQELAQQLTALTEKLQQLQRDLNQSETTQNITSFESATLDSSTSDSAIEANVIGASAIEETTIPDETVQDINLENRTVYLQETSTTIETVGAEADAEPVLGAALPAPETTASLAAPVATEVVADARLREELRAMNARPSDQGMSLVLGERYFENGSARLWSGRAARHLDNVAAVLSENPELRLDVEAHIDPSAGAEQGHDLTADRAIAIKSALVLRGVDAGRINTTGFGDTAPIADNDTPLGRMQNRRVEIIFPNVTL